MMASLYWAHSRFALLNPHVFFLWASYSWCTYKKTCTDLLVGSTGPQWPHMGPKGAYLWAKTAPVVISIVHEDTCHTWVLRLILIFLFLLFNHIIPEWHRYVEVRAILLATDESPSWFSLCCCRLNVGPVNAWHDILTLLFIWTSKLSKTFVHEVYSWFSVHKSCSSAHLWLYFGQYQESNIFFCVLFFSGLLVCIFSFSINVTSCLSLPLSA